MLPIDEHLALPVALVVTSVFILIIWASAPLTVLTEESLSARGATIDLRHVGTAVVIPRDQVFAELGRNLDARAWLAIQASIKGLIKVEIDDPKDPTPYWLISTRKPAELVKLINS